MNIAFIGGGSLRILPIVRSLLAKGNIFTDGGIRLIDLEVKRAEAVGRMIMRCPEFKKNPCCVIWTDKMEEGLTGADVLYVTMAIRREPSMTEALRWSEKHGYLFSDQLTIHGAYLAARGSGAIMGFARAMEKYCPKAIMLIFSNPVSVFSTMVNNYTKIRALGICAGFDNHRFDLPRLCGRNEHDDNIHVVAAGVNHFSFILRGEWNGRDIFEILDEKLMGDGPYSYESLASSYPRQSMAEGMDMLAKIYRRYRRMPFSSEGDGLANFFWKEVMAWNVDGYPGKSSDEIARESKLAEEKRFADFAAEATRTDEAVWRNPADRTYGINSGDISNPILDALAGGRTFRIVASAPNNGAVTGFTDRMALEYTMDISKDKITAVEDQYIPSPFYGVVAAFSNYQTVLAEALAEVDTKKFADALDAYPARWFDPGRREFIAGLFDIYNDIPKVFNDAKKYFKAGV